MENFSMKIKAENSSGIQELHFGHQEEYGGECWLTLTGKYDNHGVQLDFDTMLECDLDDLIAGLQIIKEEFNKKPRFGGVN